MEKREAEALYREMRHKFDELDNWQVSVITAYRDFERIYGKRADIAPQAEQRRNGMHDVPIF